jgi:hypothetical protein
MLALAGCCCRDKRNTLESETLESAAMAVASAVAGSLLCCSRSHQGTTPISFEGCPKGTLTKAVTQLHL